MTSCSGITAARKCSKHMEQTGMLSMRLLSGISCTGQYGMPWPGPVMCLSPVFRPRERRIVFLYLVSFLFPICFSPICFYTVMYKTWGQPQYSMVEAYVNQSPCTRETAQERHGKGHHSGVAFPMESVMKTGSICTS